MSKIKLRLKNGEKLPRHRFSNGDTASLSRVGQDWGDEDEDLTPAEIDERKFDVVVHDVKRNEVTVLVDSVTHERFQKTNSRSTHFGRFLIHTHPFRSIVEIGRSVPKYNLSATGGCT